MTIEKNAQLLLLLLLAPICFQPQAQEAGGADGLRLGIGQERQDERDARELMQRAHEFVAAYASPDAVAQLSYEEVETAIREYIDGLQDKLRKHSRTAGKAVAAGRKQVLERAIERHLGHKPSPAESAEIQTALSKGRLELPPLLELDELLGKLGKAVHSLQLEEQIHLRREVSRKIQERVGGHLNEQEIRSLVNDGKIHLPAWQRLQAHEARIQKILADIESISPDLAEALTRSRQWGLAKVEARLAFANLQKHRGKLHEEWAKREKSGSVTPRERGTANRDPALAALRKLLNFHREEWLQGRATDAQLLTRYRGFFETYPRSKYCARAYFGVLEATTRDYRRLHPGKRFPREEADRILDAAFQWSISFWPQLTAKDWPHLTPSRPFPAMIHGALFGDTIMTSHLARSDDDEKLACLRDMLSAASVLSMSDYEMILDKKCELGWIGDLKKGSTRYQKHLTETALKSIAMTYFAYQVYATKHLYVEGDHGLEGALHGQIEGDEAYARDGRELALLSEVMTYAVRLRLRHHFLKTARAMYKDKVAVELLGLGDAFALPYVAKRFPTSPHKVEILKGALEYVEHDRKPSAQRLAALKALAAHEPDKVTEDYEALRQQLQQRL